MTTKQAVIIVAGGKGERMQTIVPKQFLLIREKPVLMHTLQRFYSFNPLADFILVLPESQIEYWNSLCREHDFQLKHSLVKGGATRFESVKNGLMALNPEVDFVAIHDGVRPLVSLETIDRCFNAAFEFQAAIPVTDAVESLREITEDGSVSVDRSKFKLVQTPQVFDAGLIKQAYQQKYMVQFTDDASVVEALGHPIFLVEGNRENIKITTAVDLKLADIYMSEIQ